MNTKSMGSYELYCQNEGLFDLIDFPAKEKNIKTGAFDAVRGEGEAFPPQLADLVFLHKTIRQNKFFTILEFGVGYSTIVIADALEKNERDWEKLSEKPNIRNRFMFQLFSVDASAHWIERTQSMFPKKLLSRVSFQQSDVEAGLFNGRMCHFYKKIPDIVPDFIYLDGPAPKDVQGNINGMSFQCDERTVMSADLLLMEPTLLPGTVIVVDGRTNNVRFLKNNFQREWSMEHNMEKDVSIFRLNEERLGRYNILGLDYYI